jgi:biotin carboxyl carrier protein
VKYYVTVNGEPHVVELELHLGELVVRFDERPVDVTYREVDRLGQAALYLGERSYAVSIEGGAAKALVSVAGHVYRVDIEDERERAAHAVERNSGTRGGDVRAVMPGVVVQTLVARGETVSAGQPLLILSAMKMQNEIAAPHAGLVERIHVAEGQAVSAGERLVTLSAPAAAAGGEPAAGAPPRG